MLLWRLTLSVAVQQTACAKCQASGCRICATVDTALRAWLGACCHEVCARLLFPCFFLLASPLQRVVAKFRAAYGVRNKIEVLASVNAEDDLAGLPRELVAAVQAFRQQVWRRTEARAAAPAA